MALQDTYTESSSAEQVARQVAEPRWTLCRLWRQEIGSIQALAVLRVRQSAQLRPANAWLIHKRDGPGS